MNVEEAQQQVAAGRLAAFGLLRLHDFRYLFISMSLLVFAFEMRVVAQSWLVLSLTDSQAWVGIVAGVPSFAVVALSLVGGAAADQLPKRDILAWVRVGLGAMAFAIAYLVASGLAEVWHLLALALVQGGLVAFGMPAGTAILFDIVGRERLLSATSFNQSMTNLGVVAGPALAGVLIGLLGVGPTYAAVGGLYVVAALATLLIRSRVVVEREADGSRVAELMDGLRYVRDSPLLRVLLALNLLALFAGFVIPIIPLYARDVLKVGETGYGAMMGVFGVGGVIGSLALAMAGNVRRKSLLLMGISMLWGVGMAAFGFSRDFWLSMTILLLMGSVGPIYMTTIMTMVQTSVSDHVRGRVLSLFMMGLQFFPLGFFAGGALAASIGNELTLVIGAAGMFAVPLLTYLLSKDFREAT